jgi:hypothetical protein
MARIPYLPSVRPDAGPSGSFVTPPAVRPVPDVTSAQAQDIGQGLMRGGAEALRASEKLQDDYDDAMVQKSLTMAMEHARTAMSDPETGYLNSRGEAASGDSRTRAFRTVDDAILRIEKGLGNDVQRQQFRLQTNRFMSGVRARADAHETKEIAAFKLGTSVALLQSAVSSAVHAYDPGAVVSVQDPQDPQKQRANPFELQVNTIRATAASISQQLGESTEEAAQRLHKALSVMHSQVVQRVLTSDEVGTVARADGYLQGVPDAEIDGDVKTQLLDLISRHRAAEQSGPKMRQLLDDASLRLAKGLLQPPEPPEPAGLLSKDFLKVPAAPKPEDFVDRVNALEQQFQGRVAHARAAVEGIDDARLRDATRARLDDYVKDHAEARADQKNATRGYAQQWLSQHPGQGLRGLRLADPWLAQNVDLHGLGPDLVSFSKNLRETDTATIDALRQWSPEEWSAAADTPKAFVALYADRLDESDMKWSQEQLAKARGEKLAMPETELRERAEQAAVDIGIPVHDFRMHPDEKAKLQRWMNTFREQLQLERSRTLAEGEKHRTADDILKQMKLRYEQITATVDKRAGLDFDVDGRTVELKNLLADPGSPDKFDPDLVLRAERRAASMPANLRVDPSDFRVLAVEWVARDNERRQRTIELLNKRKGELGLRDAVDTAGDVVPGYVNLSDFQRITGRSLREIQEKVAAKSLDGQIEPFLYNYSAWTSWLPLPFPKANPPVALSTLLAARLLTDYGL